MSPDGAWDASTFLLQEDVDHKYVHQNLELILLIQYLMEYPCISF